MADTLFDELGGRPCIEEVHTIFYGKLLGDPWLKGFFEHVKRSHLESQQSDFMIALFGGPRLYGGRSPKGAHVHMFITEEVFMRRHQILEQTLKQVGIRPDLSERWLRYDLGMKNALVKNSVDECEGRYKTEPIIVVEKPRQVA